MPKDSGIAPDNVARVGLHDAAHMMGATGQDIRFEDGVFTVPGTNKNVSFGDVPLKACVPRASIPARSIAIPKRAATRWTISTCPGRLPASGRP